MGSSRTDPVTTTLAGRVSRWADLVCVVTLGWLAVGLVPAVTDRHAAGGLDGFALVGGAGLAATSTVGSIILRRTGNPIGWILAAFGLGMALNVSLNEVRVPVSAEATS